MTRDVRDRLSLFSTWDVEVKRLALNYDQVEQYNPPENPAKMTDSRASVYVAEFGMSSWELDALNPDTLADLVRQAMINLRDDTLWDMALEREAVMRAELETFVDNYNKRGRKKN